MIEKIKERQIAGVICTLLVSSCLVLASTAQADSFKRKASGWINPVVADINGELSRVSVITTHGNGKFGESVSNSMTELGAFTGEFCSFAPPEIIVIRLPLVARTNVTRFANGDLLFSTLDLDPILNSSLCIDIKNRTTVSEVHMVIAGGTGKFAGATGTLIITTSGTQLPFKDDAFLQSGLTEITEGDVFLNHYDDDDDTDD